MKYLDKQRFILLRGKWGTFPLVGIFVFFSKGDGFIFSAEMAMDYHHDDISTR